MTAVAEWRRLRQQILSPYATIERLRALVGDPGANGTTVAPAGR